MQICFMYIYPSLQIILICADQIAVFCVNLRDQREIIFGSIRKIFFLLTMLIYDCHILRLHDGKCPWRPVFRFDQYIGLFTVGKPAFCIIPEKYRFTRPGTDVRDVCMQSSHST